MLAVIAPVASAYSLYGTSSRSHTVATQIAAQAPVAVQAPFAHTAVQMRTRNTAVQMAAPAGGKKKVFVLGGDGFCGWPTALHLSNLGHDVVIIDDLSRRKIDVELGASSLTPISTPEVRVATWNEQSGKDLKYVYMDLANEYSRFLQLIKDEKPDTMVHFAEQRAAPYSMKNSATKRYTIENNMGATHNALCAIVESELDIHLVHLGTMGVYGYGNSGGEIPEGYIDVTLPGGREKNILHPAYPGSIYHSTKRAAPPLQLEPSPSTLRRQPRLPAPAPVPPPACRNSFRRRRPLRHRCLDAILFQFYVKNDQLRVTDLHQVCATPLPRPLPLPLPLPRRCRCRCRGRGAP
jgi:UDP-sulfoquinovose synthase